jgi:hypothetical protein
VSARPSSPPRDRATVEPWPALADWKDTYATLHLWTQIVGKTKLALAPWVNHSWHITFEVSARGLSTRPIPDGSRMFEVTFDFIDHRLEVRTSQGETRGLPLAPMTVADFYREFRALLQDLGIRARIWPQPVEIPDAIRFPDDRTHAAYDDAAVRRWFQALTQADRLLEAFRSRFLGKSSPVHFFWGGFDLACTRFSGRRAPRHPGGNFFVADWVMQEAYSHECISAGFWPGGGPVTEPVFYAYSYPEPAGFKEVEALPAACYYHPDFGEFVLPYEAVRAADDPDALVLEFLQGTYEAAAERAGWDREALERR